MVEFLVDEQNPGERLDRYPDMERIYFPRWLNHKMVENAVDKVGGGLWGAWYGSMFGPATNRFVAVNSAETVLVQDDLIEALPPRGMTLTIVDYQSLTPTIRPLSRTPITQFGVLFFGGFA